LKPHYPILDGLRGTAAILVVIFHLLEGLYPDMAVHPMHHGFLAVDFFYLLSGFVVGYAYDDRWTKMTFREFFTIRLIRLHPLVIISSIIGALCFWFDPFTNGAGSTSIIRLVGITLLSMTLLPTSDLRGWGETHSLNGPHWSLLQEYIANILYALFGRRLNNAALFVVVVACGMVLIVVAASLPHLGTGWSFTTFWIASVRMMFPFFAGLLLYRVGKLIRIRHAYLVCSLLLLIVFCLPQLKYNGVFEALCIIVLFPLIVAAGAGGTISGRWEKLCNFSGAISYPIYILHYPFIYIYIAWLYKTKPDSTTILWVAVGLFAFFILLSYLTLKLYDEPVREWLKLKRTENKTASA
jgi:peptidoglycan/LPS O-acetylase OafA/YrhL